MEKGETEAPTMRTNEMPPGGSRFKIEFPCGSMRSRFLEQVETWNQFDDLPHIEVEPLADGRGVSFWCADYAHVGPYSLIDSHHGRISSD